VGSSFGTSIYVRWSHRASRRTRRKTSGGGKEKIVSIITQYGGCVFVAVAGCVILRKIFMTSTPEKKQSLKQHWGCCIGILLFVGMVVFIFFQHALYYKSSGEHISVPSHYPQDATDYCFFESYTSRYCEFNLPKSSFLKYSEKQKWEIVDIEKTDVFFTCYNNDFNMSEKRQYTYEKPLTIRRYIALLKLEHHKCSQWKCEVDTTGLTENACVRSISKGYFYRTSNGAGRGITVLYDSEQERCYLDYRFR
jgi:hypothetical protein